MKAYVVDSAAVRSNLQQLQTRAGSAVLWAVLKGDGYGLGLLPMAAICREAGVTHFAVTEVSEVSRLAHISKRTLQYYDRIGLLCPSARSAAV